ncbi:hypothetical protein O6H91_10G110000 [Diphasiastrum complanatum]|uniref:Uncharacterized protein n=1 Tax=Diphasiastrum complanatum TaxID=34168 RepID=A0ACC2CKL6_DIPCM|nr:hypothetical protein O6H91_10G110000 [Diphasiastrum complanatum]
MSILIVLERSCRKCFLSVDMQSIILDSQWLAARATDVPWTGEELTTSHFPSAESKDWMEAVVPGTVLATLLRNGVIPDPFYGLNNQNVVDIADAGREHYTFWFSTQFSVPTSGYSRAWLQFRGINYSAEVFFNGHRTILPGGMFYRHKLDVTEWVNKEGPNFLAVLVNPPDHPGRIPPEGGQGGDHSIARDVAAQYVEGWDWIIPIRDRNTGIWDEVTVFFTGPIVISNPHLVASFAENYQQAYLHISTELTNTSPVSALFSLKAQVDIDVEENICSLEQIQSKDLEIPAGETIVAAFDPMLFKQPQLWWPNGMGDQPLYTVSIFVEISEQVESDSWKQLFGFRKIESFIDSSTGGRIFQVNSQPVFIRGGNWIVSDGLLRFSKARYDTDIRFHADMNMNMIRVWGGALSERPMFYDACDKRGILVWQEFWITGDCNGRGVPPSNPNWPDDHDVFLRCAKDTIKLLRNHASLALWVGGNEQHPAEDLNTSLATMLKIYAPSQFHGSCYASKSKCNFLDDTEDPSLYLDGTRSYIQGSLWGGFAKGNGDFTDGPYTIQNPEDFFKEDFYAYGFNPELGSVGVPVAATIKSTMPPEAWEPPELKILEDGSVQEIANPTWEYHTYIPYSNPGKVPYQIGMYGNPKDLDDFCRKAQLVNYIQYRALYESWNSRMWTKYTGLLLWKTQNPWPGLRGQLYDHFLDQTGGFFGIRSALEPVHVQLNLATHSVEIVNTTRRYYLDSLVEVAVWNLEGESPYSSVLKNVSVPPYKTISILDLPYGKTPNVEPVYFLILKFFDDAQQLISRNFYWLHPLGGNYKPLEGLFKSKKVPVQLSKLSLSLDEESCKLVVRVENLSKYIERQERNKSISKEKRYDENCLIHEVQSKNLARKTSLYVQEVCSNSDPGSTACQGQDLSTGVAFWLHFSVKSGRKEISGIADSRLLPVNYSQNYFSLAPAESVDVEISFQFTKNDVPKLVLQGWNIEENFLNVA